jgi:glycerate dehydrogenase
LKNPLIGAKNCIITPHIAWAPVETRNRMMEMIEFNIQSFLDGKIQSRIV